MIKEKLHGDVLEIIISNPPVNALGAGVRSALLQAVNAAQSNADVKAIVLRGEGKLFSGGADIAEFEGGMAEPWLPTVIDALEASSKPVIAAIRGMALGGGLELALGCHYRVATSTAKLGLPEVKLGLIPGAGGTQRLPRIVSAEFAARMIVSGNPISGSQAAELGLVDLVAEDDALEHVAIEFAREVEEIRPTSARTPSVDLGAFEKFDAETRLKARNLQAPVACLDAVKAGLTLPIAQGLQKEQELFQQLLEGEQSKGLRHAFFAERKAAKIVGLSASAGPKPIMKVGVIGAGTMGGGIAMNFLSNGIPVTIVETLQEALDRGIGVIRRNYEASAAKGRLQQEEVDAALAILDGSLDFDALADADLIIEAVYENMALKKDIFVRLDQIAKPGAILASNTSFLDIDSIAGVTSRAGDVLGLHFFSPANVMKLVEVIRGNDTSDEVLATGMDIARKIGKVPVVSGVCYGFIGNRMLLARQDNADALLLEGAMPEDVDKVHTEFGMPMGPFQMADLAGVDILWHRDPACIETIADALCAQDRWGQKKGAGYYDYDEKRRPSPSPVVHALIEKFRAQSALTPRPISHDEIVVRTLYTMVNEGAKILEEGIAQRASDIDVVWLHGYGWPAPTGGPMFWANRIGLSTIVDGLRRYRSELGETFELSPLLVRCAEENLPLDVQSA